MQLPARFDIDECQAFFVLFARFEYAMKVAGIRQPSKSGSVEADWGKLAEDVGSELFSSSDAKLKQACCYILKHPPKRQDLDGEHLVWSNVPADQGNDARDLFIYVRRVRNNLFHGGKFRGRNLADPERAAILITAVSTILSSVLEMRPQLCEAFNG